MSGVSATTSRERAKLRGYLERLLGWDDAPAIKHALRSVDLATTHQRTERTVRERDGPRFSRRQRQAMQTSHRDRPRHLLAHSP